MKRLAVFALVVAALSSGCTLQPRQQLRLYVFDCGRVRLASVEAFGIADHETDIREAPFPCYMIEHPRGRLLWDGGMPSSVAQTRDWQQAMPGYWVRLDRTLGDQLGELGLTLDSLDYIVFSHFHWDHVGIANELRKGTVIVQQAEYDAAFAPEVKVPGFRPETYARVRELDKRFVDGDHDVFGDGRVRIISAPGHTPGHHVLLVRLTETGPVVLSGDLYHFRISREKQSVPVFNVDPVQSRQSMQRVETLLRETGAELWIHHDPELFASQKKAPHYYR